MSFHTLPQQAWAVYLSLIVGLALWRGGRSERIAGLAALAASFASQMAQNRSDWLDPQWGVLVVDLALLGVLVWVTLTSTRYWPMFAAAFQLLGVVTHVAMMVDRTVNAWAYVTAGVIWSHLVLIPLGVGTWNRWRSERLAPS